jgi:cytochrome c6
MIGLTACGSLGAKKPAMDPAATGRSLFEKHCAMCHPDGGNMVRPGKTLHRRDLDAANIKTVEDIVWVMRNPKVGMTRFHNDVLPDREARKIARYITETFR